MPKETFDFEELIHETDLAYLVEIEGDEYWLPKSQCDIDEDDQTIEMPNWLAREKGL